MSVASVPVDLCNPGQVFACLGLMEMTEILSGPCMVRFNYLNSETECRFELAGPEDCVEKAVQFLANCQVFAFAPLREVKGEVLSAEKWKVSTVTAEGSFFPGITPGSPEKLPVRLIHADIGVPIEHWLDGIRVGRDSFKLWAGSGGYPGAALARDAVSILRSLDHSSVTRIALDPFAYSAPMDSSFRLDWRRDYIPLDAGFSPNEQPSIRMVGFPLVELLAAIGLQDARPYRIAPKNKLAYRYHVTDTWLQSCLARAVLGSETTGFPLRTFRVELGWPGKENQARCIINAEEECL